MKIEGIKELENLLRKLKVRESVVSNIEKEVDLDTVKTFLPGPFLHKDVKDDEGNIVISEHESAKFEKDNQKLFNWLRDVGFRMRRSLEG